jgi:hypothetical protein
MANRRKGDKEHEAQLEKDDVSVTPETARPED